MMWELWDTRSAAQPWFLRGALSDMLPLSTTRAMSRRGPIAELIEFAGVGHLPALMTKDQIEPIISFLGAA
jgi:hypothetical protein